MGDFELKYHSQMDEEGYILEPREFVLSAQPDITCIERDHKNDNYITICCDGVFDVQDNHCVMEYLTDRIPAHKNLEKISEEYIDFCCFKVMVNFW